MKINWCRGGFFAPGKSGSSTQFSLKSMQYPKWRHGQRKKWRHASVLTLYCFMTPTHSLWKRAVILVTGKTGIVLAAILHYGHYIVHCVVSHCALWSFHCAICKSHFALWTLHCAMWLFHYAFWTSHCAMSILHFAIWLIPLCNVLMCFWVIFGERCNTHHGMSRFETWLSQHAFPNWRVVSFSI